MMHIIITHGMEKKPNAHSPDWRPIKRFWLESSIAWDFNTEYKGRSETAIKKQSETMKNPNMVMRASMHFMSERKQGKEGWPNSHL